MVDLKERIEKAITINDNPDKPNRINLGELKKILLDMVDEMNDRTMGMKTDLKL